MAPIILLRLPEARFDRASWGRQVIGALRHQPARFSGKEAARIFGARTKALGINLGTVKIRLRRARGRLKEELGSGCNFYRDERNELACEPKPGGRIPRRLTSVHREVTAMKLDDRITELIAVGASVTANRLSCLEYHVGKAAEYGVDEQEVVQVVEIGKMVRRGAAAKMDKLAESLPRAAPSEASGVKAGCGCA